MIFNERWRSRLEPDDLRYFAEDGMLTVNYVPAYPLPFTVSPLLGIVETDGRMSAVNRLLAASARDSRMSCSKKTSIC